MLSGSIVYSIRTPDKNQISTLLKTVIRHTYFCDAFLCRKYHEEGGKCMNLMSAKLFLLTNSLLNPPVLKENAFTKEDPTGDVAKIVSGIFKIANQVWGFVDGIATALGLIAIVAILIKMVVSADSKTVAECKKQLLIVAVAIVAIKFAGPLINMVANIADTGTTAAGQ